MGWLALQWWGQYVLTEGVVAETIWRTFWRAEHTLYPDPGVMVVTWVIIHVKLPWLPFDLHFLNSKHQHPPSLSPSAPPSQFI